MKKIGGTALSHKIAIITIPVILSAGFVALVSFFVQVAYGHTTVFSLRAAVFAFAVVFVIGWPILFALMCRTRDIDQDHTVE